MFTRIFIVISFLLLGSCAINSVTAQSNIDRMVEKADKKNARKLEKSYKKALKHHNKIQTSRGNKRRKRTGRKAKLARDNKQGLFGKRTKGGSYRKGIRKVNKRSKAKAFKRSTRSRASKIGKGISRGFGKIGNAFRKIKLPKIKWPRVFKKK